MGDLNVKVGRGRSGKIEGDFDLGVEIERGNKLTEWCESWGHVVMTTHSGHHSRHLYTCRSPEGKAKN